MTADTAKQSNAKITIDGIDYEIAALGEQSRRLISSIRATDREMRRQELQLSLLRIARQTLAANLKNELAQNIPNTGYNA